MNKVLNINLGSIPFTIDDDAYRILENYLQSLHNHFKQSEGYEEIMNDIEARMAELLSEGMGKRSIVGQQDVKNAISIMGKPEDFGAESVNEGATTSKSTGNKSTTEGGIRTGKRLFRDGENKMVGGVCSGLAAYFGLGDPTWIRILLAVLAFTMGTGFVLYFILWAVIPEAKTTADRLAMHGEPIDVNSIAKAVAEGVENFSNKVNEFGSPEEQAKFNNQVHQVTSQVGNALKTILRGFGGVAKIIAIIVGIGLIIGLLVSWVSAAVGIGWAYPVFGYITDSDWMPRLAIFNVFCILAIPAVGIILMIRRIFFKGKTNGTVTTVLWITFVANIMSLGSLAGRTAKQFNHNAFNEQKINIEPNIETLNISSMPNGHGQINTQIGDIYISDDFLISEDVILNISKSENDKFELIESVSAHGGTNDEARRLSSSLDYQVQSQGNELKLANSFIIPRGTKWRGQKVQLRLKVPIGKKIKIARAGDYDDRVRYHIIDTAGKWHDNEACWDDDVAIWQMTEDGMKCLNKKKTATEE
jgi:phage shock protein PspC (stress-responsive transcriptional regulator)